MFRADGGDVDLVGVDGGVVVVRLQGACAACAASTQTLHQALEPRLRERLAWVEGVRRDA
jgi:Fe-S cluster biogenesis protein NfuA